MSDVLPSRPLRDAHLNHHATASVSVGQCRRWLVLRFTPVWDEFLASYTRSSFLITETPFHHDTPGLHQHWPAVNLPLTYGVTNGRGVAQQDRQFDSNTLLALLFRIRYLSGSSLITTNQSRYIQRTTLCSSGLIARKINEERVSQANPHQC